MTKETVDRLNLIIVFIAIVVVVCTLRATIL